MHTSKTGLYRYMLKLDKAPNVNPWTSTKDVLFHMLLQNSQQELLNCKWGPGLCWQKSFMWIEKVKSFLFLHSSQAVWRIW